MDLNTISSSIIEFFSLLLVHPVTLWTIIVVLMLLLFVGMRNFNDLEKDYKHLDEGNNRLHMKLHAQKHVILTLGADGLPTCDITTKDLAFLEAKYLADNIDKYEWYMHVCYNEDDYFTILSTLSKHDEKPRDNESFEGG